MSSSRLLALVLALVTLLVFLPATQHGFSIFDDKEYVTQNQVVQDGLTWPGFRWAFVTWHAGNWHPLTWLSHMVDCELFGLNAGAHHFVNVLLHVANAVLLFALFRRLTGLLWPSLFIAALFAWHPLRVESVAWIAERKDVLSTLFALLTLHAYVEAVDLDKARVKHTPIYRSPFYWLALLCFALGLLAKPMLVTLPFVLLLLDYWPLQRISNFEFQISNFRAVAALVAEKIPFFLLMAASCFITFLAQHSGGMVASLEEIPLGNRLGNVPLAYLLYLEKMVWPARLAVFYPLPKTLSVAGVLLSIVVLLAITMFVWHKRKRRPYAFVGWLWFLGTLVPVIGFVQVGQAAMADRYSYFPSIGISVAVTFAFYDGIKRFAVRPASVAIGAGLVLGLCLALTEKQLSYWRDDVRLFSHALSVTQDNEPVRGCLGLALEAAGRKAEALAEYRVSLKLNPYRMETYGHLADVLADTGQTNEALATLQQGLQIKPNDGPTHVHLARLMADSGRTNEALAEFQTALQINPADAIALRGHGILLAADGRLDEAMKNYAEAARLDPADWRSPYLTGQLLLKQNRVAEAILYFFQALKKNPEDVQLLLSVAQVLAADENPNVRDGTTALALASKARALAGADEPSILDTLGMAYAELGRFDDAQEAVQTALRINATNGATNETGLMRQRLQLYQSHQPYRQSHAGGQPAK
jgi:tetratricopeptide (TPR) repeat protein